MRIPIEAWTIYDWQGPSSGVRFRITADDSFLARENDNTGVEIDASPKVFREVDCVVGSTVIDGLPVKTITIPTLWLYSTTDAIVNRTARYSAKFVTTRGGDIKQLDLLQSFQLPVHILDVFNPVPWKEIIRFNYPAAPVPIDRTTFSTEQILELIGDTVINKGLNAQAKRIAFWSTAITVDGVPNFEFQSVDNNVAALNYVPPSTLFNSFRIAEGVGNANVKVGGSPALFSTHLTDQTGIWHHAFVNDAATRRWAQFVRDGALGLQFSAYDNSNILQSNTIFDPAGGVGFSDGTNPDFGYFYKASAAYHIGINAAGAGASGATKEITFTTSGVGINKSASIGAQLHVVSGNAGRIATQIDSAPSPTQPLLVLRNDTGVRYSFNHDGVATFGLASSVKGRLNFAAAANANIHSLEAPDTPAANVQYKLPATSPAAGQLLRTLSFGAGVAVLEWVNPTAGGDVSSSIGTTVDNRLARFDGTTGKLIQDSVVVVADTTGSFTVPTGWTITDAGGATRVLNGTTQSFTTATVGTDTTVFSFSTGVQTQAGSGFAIGAQVNLSLNQTASANSHALNLQRTETALGSGQHNFIRGVGGAAGTTLRFRIDNLGNYFFGALTGQFIGDSNNNELLVFSGVASAVNEITVSNAAASGRPKLQPSGGDTNIPLELAGKGTSPVFLTSDLTISKDSPFITLIDSVSGSGTNFAVNFNGGFTAIGRSAQSDLLLNNTSGEYTFGVIPQLPASDPTTGNQATRKTYVDTRRMRWAITFVYPNLNIIPTATDFSDIPGALIPGANFIATHIFTKVANTNGGGGLTGGTIVTIRKQPFANQTQTDLGGFNYNAGGGDVTTVGVGVEHSNSPLPHTFSANDFVYPVVSAGGGSTNAKMVWVGIRGYQTTENP